MHNASQIKTAHWINPAVPNGATVGLAQITVEQLVSQPPLIHPPTLPLWPPVGLAKQILIARSMPAVQSMAIVGMAQSTAELMAPPTLPPLGPAKQILIAPSMPAVPSGASVDMAPNTVELMSLPPPPLMPPPTLPQMSPPTLPLLPPVGPAKQILIAQSMPAAQSGAIVDME